jgi:hypothetical protein
VVFFAAALAVPFAYRWMSRPEDLPSTRQHNGGTEVFLRKALGVTRTNNEGSQCLIRAASEHGAEQLCGKRLPTKQVERRRQTAHELQLDTSRQGQK